MEKMDESKGQNGEAERRKHVETALADSRIEGFPPPSGAERDILDAYIRGEIEAKDRAGSGNLDKAISGFSA
jgi:hypothetical protein